MLIKDLMKLQDLKYRDFVSKLIPTIPKEEIIGIRTQEIKNFCKNIYLNKTDIPSPPYNYHEEYLVYIRLLEYEKDFDEFILKLEKILPFINNWALSDSFRSKLIKQNSDKFFKYIKKWLKSKNIYTKRAAIVFLINYYLDDTFNKEHLNLVINLQGDDYYLNMAIAWYICSALTKQYDNSIFLIKDKLLNKWVNNKAIQKCIESLKFTKEQKEYLKTFKM